MSNVWLGDRGDEGWIHLCIQPVKSLIGMIKHLQSPPGKCVHSLTATRHIYACIYTFMHVYYATDCIYLSACTLSNSPDIFYHLGYWHLSNGGADHATLLMECLHSNCPYPITDPVTDLVLAGVVMLARWPIN